MELGMLAHTCNSSTWELRQEDCCKFEAGLGHIARSYLKNKTMTFLTKIIIGNTLKQKP